MASSIITENAKTYFLNRHTHLHSDLPPAIDLDPWGIKWEMIEKVIEIIDHFPFNSPGIEIDFKIESHPNIWSARIAASL
jgi:hypothetical protein